MAKDDGHDYHGEADHKSDDERYDNCTACIVGYCKTCHGADASLTTQCPDRALTEWEDKCVVAGVLDYRDDRWVLGWAADRGALAAAIHGLIDESMGKFMDLPKALREKALESIKHRPEPEHVAADGTVRKDHYGHGRQPWDDIVSLGWSAPFAAGNALKYVRRYKAKNGADDLEKGRWYFEQLVAMARSMDPLRPSTDGPEVLAQLMAQLGEEEVRLLVEDNKQ